MSLWAKKCLYCMVSTYLVRQRSSHSSSEERKVTEQPFFFHFEGLKFNEEAFCVVCPCNRISIRFL